MIFTPFSLALVKGARALFGTVCYMDKGKTEAAFVIAATRTPVPVSLDDDFTSRGNVTNAAVRDGSALLTGSTMSVASLDLRANRFYGSLPDAIRNASVGDNTPEEEKERIIAALYRYYSDWSK